ncbi:DUF5803 family protein [Halobacterium litoreum]|uniref:DUF5803 family protein n=1 Tax=Halobacterium litoreum TaxID=2039234 RepID=A0ABD5NIG9_9EURY|nr:DUF5803 family protein [Halobacterium litoreum]UHH12201.1 DUF5803 family protein [Halobacterium litoreum]
MRKLLVAVAVAALAVSAGCLGAGGGGPSQQQLEQNATYDWQKDTDVAIDVGGGEYRVVATVDNQSEVRLARNTGFGGRNALSISAVQFRYENGTQVGADAIDVSTRNSRTIVTFPASNGTFAYSANAGGRSVTVPVGFEGSHELVLPSGMRVSVPVFGVVEPSGWQKTVEDNRVHVRWESLDGGTIDAKYYLQRDLLLFGGITGALTVVALLGVVYYRLQIRRLEDEREQAGLDVEE